LFFDQLIRDAVVMVIYFDVVIDVDPGLLPFCIFIGFFRKRF